MSALVTQLKTMTDEELKSALSAMVEKVTRIKVSMLDGDIKTNIAMIDKLKRIKEKYAFVEAELEARKIISKENVSPLIDIVALKQTEAAKVASILADLGVM